MCKQLLLKGACSNNTATRRGARLKPYRDRCWLDWCVGVVSEERGMCRERDRQEGCAGSGGAQKCGAQKWDDGERSTARAGGIGQAEVEAEGSDGLERAAMCEMRSRLGRVSSTVADTHVSPIFNDGYGHLTVHSAGSDASVGALLDGCWNEAIMHKMIAD